MKKFKRHRTLEEVQALCDAQGVELRRRLYDEGKDFVSLHSVDALVIYAPDLGRFQGMRNGESFSHERDQPDDWYQALVNFFYTDEDPPK